MYKQANSRTGAVFCVWGTDSEGVLRYIAAVIVGHGRVVDAVGDKVVGAEQAEVDDAVDAGKARSERAVTGLLSSWYNSSLQSLLTLISRVDYSTVSSEVCWNSTPYISQSRVTGTSLSAPNVATYRRAGTNSEDVVEISCR